MSGRLRSEESQNWCWVGIHAGDELSSGLIAIRPDFKLVGISYVTEGSDLIDEHILVLARWYWDLPQNVNLCGITIVSEDTYQIDGWWVD